MYMCLYVFIKTFPQCIYWENIVGGSIITAEILGIVHGINKQVKEDPRCQEQEWKNTFF